MQVKRLQTQFTLEKIQYLLSSSNWLGSEGRVRLPTLKYAATPKSTSCNLIPIIVFFILIWLINIALT